MCPLVLLAPPCRLYLLSQSGLTLIAGSRRLIAGPICGASVGMAVRALDLEPYYSHPRRAGCQVLLQVEVKGAQFVVWQADRVIKTLSIKGLLRQEMTIDDYLKYIRAEALAYERRSSTRSSAWCLRQLSLW